MITGVNQTLIFAETNAEISDQSVIAMLDAMGSAGIKWLRTQFNWSWFEETKGTWKWAFVDFVMAEAKARGISVLGILGGSPLWANGNRQYYPPTDLAAWATFVQTAMERYPEVEWWEIWNEQNIDFWQPKPNVEEYMALVRATPKLAGRKLCFGGVAGVPGVGAGASFVEDCLKLGVSEYVDAIAYHPYATLLPVAWWQWFNRDPQEAIAVKCLNDVRALITRYTTKPLQIWLTEIGWTSGGWQWWQTVTEKQQAEYWARCRRAYAEAEADAIFYYDLWEMAPVGSFSAMFAVNHFGLFYHDFKAKPIVSVFQ